ncbi:MAG: VanZ family protein [Pyrinomonadaceae bacterium]
MNSQKINRRARFFRYAPLLLWIGVVLFASTGNASMAQTSRFIRPVLEFLFPNAPDETLQIYHFYIRKSAHFTEYAILAFWAARAFAGSAKPFLRKYWFIISFILVLTIASIDETNQSFNPSRTGSPRDVLLDCAGGAFMILIFAIFRTAKDRKKTE